MRQNEGIIETEENKRSDLCRELIEFKKKSNG